MRTLLAAVALALVLAAPAEAAWPGTEGRLSFVTERDGKLQTRVGPLDLRPTRRIAWYRPGCTGRAATRSGIRRGGG